MSFFWARTTHCDFFCRFLRTNPLQTSIFLHRIHSATFSALLCWRFGENNNAYQDPFYRLNSAPLCRMWTQFYLILSFLLSTFTHVTAILSGQIVPYLFYFQHLHTSLQFYLDKLPVLHKDAWRKIHCGARGHNNICFNAIYLFCRIVHRYLREKFCKHAVLVSGKLVLVWSVTGLERTTDGDKLVLITLPVVDYDIRGRLR